MVRQNHSKAFDLYRNLAENGLARAQVVLGRCYESGEGIDQDYDTAILWYSKAADQANEDGRLHSAFLRGWFSLIGHDVEQSDVNALNHWQEVSTLSTDPVLKPIATHMVGWMHYLGRGTVRDEQKGIKTIRDSKSPEFPLGEDECLAVPRSHCSDSPVARKLFNLCQLGSERDWLCRHLMAVCLFQGFGVAVEEQAAADIFEQLANDGHSDSQLWFSECFRYQGNVLQNARKAFKWFGKSAEQGNSYGQWMLGYCHRWGDGVPEDHPKAAEWYRKSAEQGNRNGQFELGDCYQFGRGVANNIDIAVFWYRKSAEQGHDRAIYILQGLSKWP
ncbi:uncharacterized protein BJ171DRAFT_229782 [Polychytrium aggregatum]|uniref:uncharacterized protein n=1 Tax=Polychytrium aggregatum TaxID=110093 RepID=UPI0022FEFAD9|nr:uncharacterized protein BJ171DRAFT_229782 [Polychytrium aggregatum]KAI9197227.1 hypothetical protein BJ171DRAFT_229782 [Polychytrium aggregatum]